MAGSFDGNDLDADFAPGSDINVTPFIDVLLVLLVIFMLAVPLSTTSVTMDLPSSRAAPAPPPPVKPVELSVRNDGKIFVGDEPLGKRDLRSALTAAGAIAETRILVRADKGMRYGDLMATLDRLRDAGFFRVSLVGLADGA